MTKLLSIINFFLCFSYSVFAMATPLPPEQLAHMMPERLAPPERSVRVGSYRIDRSQPKVIYLAPGLGSVVTFPCTLVEVFVGRNEDLKAQISPNDKKTLYLSLRLNTSLPTNLIVKCEGPNQIFVFDVFPSKMKHQDLVEIRGIHNRPTVFDRSPQQIGLPQKKKIVLSPPSLMKAGEK